MVNADSIAPVQSAKPAITNRLFMYCWFFIVVINDITQADTHISTQQRFSKRSRRAEICRQMPLSQRWYKNLQKNISPNQKKAINELWPVYGVNLTYSVKLDPQNLFPDKNLGSSTYKVLDIGFGSGDSLVGMASRNPYSFCIGCEIHKASIATTLLKISAHNLNNVKVIRADIRLLLENHLQLSCLDEVCVFFPDPWPNERDMERRVIRANILQMLAHCMKDGGHLRVATDVDAYALHVEEAINIFNNKSVLQAPSVPLTSGGEPSHISHGPPREESHQTYNFFWERRDISEIAAFSGVRPTTKYELKGIEEGRAIHDLVFKLHKKTL